MMCFFCEVIAACGVVCGPRCWGRYAPRANLLERVVRNWSASSIVQRFEGWTVGDPLVCNNLARRSDLPIVRHRPAPAAANGDSTSPALHLVHADDDRGRTLLEALNRAGYAADLIVDLDALAARVDRDLDSIVVVHVENHDCFNALAGFAERHPASRLVMLARLKHGDDFMRALESGVSGFCDVESGADAIVRTVDDVVDHGVGIPRAHVNSLVESLRLGRGRIVSTPEKSVEVTDREWEVLGHLRLGHTTSEIAEVLYISPATVRSHVAALVRKLGAEDRVAMVRLLDDM